MDKDSKWYKAIQVLYNTAEKYGDVPISSPVDDNMTRVYNEVKAISNKHSDPFITDLLVAFTVEKRREGTKHGKQEGEGQT